MKKPKTIQFSRLPRRVGGGVSGWYNKPFTLTIRIKKSTLIILGLIGYIIYSHVASAAPMPSDTPFKRYQIPAQSFAQPVKKIPTVQEAAMKPIPVPVAPTPVIGCGSDPYMAQIYMHESGCNTASVNSIGCAGLGQACPGSKLPCSLSDWTCQNNYFVNYAIQRYGSPAGAWAAWQSKGWW